VRSPSEIIGRGPVTTDPVNKDGPMIQPNFTRSRRGIGATSQWRRWRHRFRPGGRHPRGVLSAL